MRLTVRQLRKVIRETLEEMKLGVAGGRDMYGSKEPDDDDAPHPGEVKNAREMLRTSMNPFSHANVQHYLPYEELDWDDDTGFQHKDVYDKPEYYVDEKNIESVDDDGDEDDHTTLGLPVPRVKSGAETKRLPKK